MSSSGAVTQDDPNRGEGAWNQTMGSAKESLGGLVGAEELKKEGQRQNQEGKGQEAQGQLSDLGSGYGESNYPTRLWGRGKGLRWVLGVRVWGERVWGVFENDG